jgi:flagellin FlaB
MNRILKDESGITALETAIILIAFVVVAAVFAFTILQAGTFSTERDREAIYGGIEQVSSSMEVVGSVKATDINTPDDYVDDVIFELRTVSGGSGVDMDAVSYSYSDPSTYVAEITCTESWLVGAGSMLEANEIVEVTCEVDAANLAKSTQFQLEVKPPTGAVIPIVRTTPAEIVGTMVLNY